jgi:hypothetical protein
MTTPLSDPTSSFHHLSIGWRNNRLHYYGKMTIFPDLFRRDSSLSHKYRRATANKSSEKQAKQSVALGFPVQSEGSMGVSPMFAVRRDFIRYSGQEARAQRSECERNRDDADPVILFSALSPPLRSSGLHFIFPVKITALLLLPTEVAAYRNNMGGTPMPPPTAQTLCYR